MDNKIFLKENLFLFKNVPSEEIDKILEDNKFEEKHYSAGETIQGITQHEKIGIISKGKATVRSGIDGVILNKLNKGDIYGVAAMFNEPTHSTIVVATSECSVITMDKPFVTACISENKQISLNYIEFLSKKINFLNKKINACTAKSAENKLYNYLLQLPRAGNVIQINVDMSTIAKMLGIGRATLYRAFEKLIENGTIAKSDKIITLNEV